MMQASPTTSDKRAEMFGAHIPELQLGADDYRNGFQSANMAAGMTYVELGSGHGIGLVMAAYEFGANARGVEYLPSAIDKTMSLADKRNVSHRVSVERGDLRSAKIDDADVLYMHLGPAFHDIMAGRIEACVSAQTIVLAAGWKVPGWLPLREHLDTWDAGYVYRPADPGMQVSWGESGVIGSDTVRMGRAHASLRELEAWVHFFDSEEVVRATVANGENCGKFIDVERGEEFFVGWPSSLGAVKELSISAICRRGIRKQRGQTFSQISLN